MVSKKELATKKAAETRPMSANAEVGAELQVGVAPTDLTGLISTMTSNTPQFGDAAGTGSGSWAAKLLTRNNTTDNLLTQIVGLLFAKVSQVVTPFGTRLPDTLGNLDLTSDFSNYGSLAAVQANATAIGNETTRAQGVETSKRAKPTLLASATAATALTKDAIQPLNPAAALTNTALPALSTAAVGDTYWLRNLSTFPVTQPFSGADATATGATSVVLNDPGTIEIAAVANPNAATSGQPAMFWEVVNHVRSDATLHATYAFRSRAPFYNRSEARLHKFARAQQKMYLGIADCKMLCVGPSTVQGIGSSTNATVPQWRSWPFQLGLILNAGYAPAASGFALPKTTSSAQAADTRWTLGSGWAQGSATYVGAGNKNAFYAGTGVTAGSLVFADSTIVADSFDVYYVANNTGGTFTVQATGGSSSTVNVASQGGTVKNLQKVTVTAASAATTNTVTITGATASKTVSIVGIEPYLSTTRKIRVANMGVSGSNTADWVGENNPGTTFWGGLDMIKLYAPDLTIIDAGLFINDLSVGTITQAQGLANFQQIITAAQVSGDVLIKTGLPSTSTASTGSAAAGTLPAAEASYVAPLIALGLPLVDTFTGLGGIGGGDFLAAQGDMYSDGLHGSDFAYGSEAQMLMSFFRSM